MKYIEMAVNNVRILEVPS